MKSFTITTPMTATLVPLSSSSLSNGDGNTKDGICTKFALVGRTIELDQEVVNFLLLSNGEPRLNQSRSDRVVDICDGFGDTLRNTFVNVK